MDRYFIPAMLALAALVGLWQCFQGFRKGKMFAFDPAGSATSLSRSDGWLFIVSWWFTLLASLGAFAFALDFLTHDQSSADCSRDCTEVKE